MAEKNAVLLKHKYVDYIKSAGLSGEDGWELMCGIVEYDKTGETPVFANAVLTGIFAVIKIDLDENKEKWEEVALIKSEAGKAGASKRWEKNRKPYGANGVPQKSAEADGRNGICYEKGESDSRNGICQENAKTMAKMHDSDSCSCRKKENLYISSSESEESPDFAKQPPDEVPKAESRPPPVPETCELPEKRGERFAPAPGNPAKPPGESPDYASEWQTILSEWNSPKAKYPLPPFKRHLGALNYHQREIFRLALETFTCGQIVNAVKNYRFVRDNPEKYAMKHNYSSVFTFLEKAIGVFYIDDNIDRQFLRTA